VGTLAAPHVVLSGRVYSAVKRALDVGLCLVSLPIVLPLGLVIAIAILLDSGRPVFFTQIRVGKNGRLFRMHKFRTLRCEGGDQASRFMEAYIRGEVGETGNRLFKPSGNQVTSVGRILRRTSLDELPQVINVLKREMSLVGPRPHIPKEVQVYKPWHRRRLSVLPGMTGFAQVHGRSALPFDTMVRHDVEYIEKQSITLDAKILAKTVIAVLRGAGAGLVLIAVKLVVPGL